MAEGAQMKTQKHMPTTKFIPAELMRTPRWVCWAPDKAPMRAAGAGRASSTDASTWTTYATAVERAEHDDALVGVGYVLTGDGIVGIDLDDVLDGEALMPWAAELIRTLDTYTERTPSGEGVHMFVRGTLPDGMRKQQVMKDGSALECYTTGRYFTVTGDALTGCRQINTLTDAGIALHMQHLQKPATPVQSARITEPRTHARTGEGTPYGLTALRAECDALASTTEGSRNSALNTAALKAGSLVAGGELSEHIARSEILQAALACGLPQAEIEATMRSGFSAGMQQPRSAPQSSGMKWPDSPPPRRERPAPPSALTLLDSAWEALQFTQGMKVAGIYVPAYPLLSDAVYGLRGITLLTGPTGAGKTTMTLSMALSVADGANIDCETCEPLPDTERAQVVYVSAEREPEILITHMMALIAQIPLRQLLTGLHTLTAEQDDRLQSARNKLAHLFSTTLHVVGADDVDMWWDAEWSDTPSHPLIGLQEQVQKLTDGKRALVIIDTLACLNMQPAEGARPNMSDLDTDRDITHGLRRWRKHLKLSHSAILAVHEESKGATGSGDTHAVSGSRRYAYGADALLAMMYAEHPEGTRSRGIRTGQIHEGATEIDLMINKARDGGRAGSTIALVHAWQHESKVNETGMWSHSQRMTAERSPEAKKWRVDSKKETA